jgi:Arc/MetJ family transcription regulator
MATNLHLEEKLLLEVLRLSGKGTKREAVNEALLEYVQRHRQKEIIRVFGKIVFDADYDYKIERHKR